MEKNRNKAFDLTKVNEMGIVNSAVTPVILCGGSGTRLWPLSRAGFPKQFLCLDGRDSLLQQAARRISGQPGRTVPPLAPLVVCSEEHRFLALGQLKEIGLLPEALILEPAGRNTAPALTLAALAASGRGEDPVLLVTPADQMIRNPDIFGATLTEAIKAAECDAIVTLGVPPTRPDTGYGYLLAASSDHGVQTVEQFVEKPDPATARRYIEHGGYFWNSGIFVLRASIWLKALASHRPDIATATREAWEKRGSEVCMGARFIRPGKGEFETVPAESIDYAVMERCPGTDIPVRMLVLDAGWSDVGTWNAVWQELPKDDFGNSVDGDALIDDSRDCLVRASNRLVALIGVRNLVVIETPDAVLVCDRSQSQKVKAAVARLHDAGRHESVLHRKVHRPWGWYDTIDEGGRFKVKHIQVNPRASLSLQKHYHRAEHWIVVRGTAEITTGERVVLLTENQSTYIPLGENHRLANPGNIPLEIIEVQSGSYLGEDDIVRLDDHYGRPPA